MSTVQFPGTNLVNTQMEMHSSNLTTYVSFPNNFKNTCLVQNGRIENNEINIMRTNSEVIQIELKYL